MPRLFNFARFAVVLILFAGIAHPLFAGTDFPIPPGRASWPYAMAVGPDGNMWFVEWGGQKVGFITTSGVITQYPIPNAQALIGIAKGPDGNLWFTDTMAGTIGHISTSGTNIVHYSLPAGSFPQGITAGPDGNLWFVEQKESGDYDIGKITTAGKITSYSTKETAGTFQVFAAVGYSFGVITPGPDGNLRFVNPQNELHSQVGRITTAGVITFYATSDLPVGITSGPDGNLWLIELSHVAKMTTSGAETEYALTQAGYAGIAAGPDGNIWFSETNSGFGKVVPTTGAVTEYPALFPAFEYAPSIVSGPDGNLWFTSSFSSSIGRMTTAASVTGNFALSTGANTFYDTAGPDGNLWFTISYPANGVGKMTPEGVVTTYPLLTANAQPSGITAGPDGNLWLLETAAYKIAKVTTSGVVTEYPANGYSFFAITAGPDGNLWFPYIYANSLGGCSAIGRITTSGTISVFPTTTASSNPAGRTRGARRQHLVYRECGEQDREDEHCGCGLGRVSDQDQSLVFERDYQRAGREPLVFGKYGIRCGGKNHYLRKSERSTRRRCRTTRTASLPDQDWRHLVRTGLSKRCRAADDQRCAKHGSAHHSERPGRRDDRRSGSQTLGGWRGSRARLPGSARLAAQA